MLSNSFTWIFTLYTQKEKALGSRSHIQTQNVYKKTIIQVLKSLHPGKQNIDLLNLQKIPQVQMKHNFET